VDKVILLAHSRRNKESTNLESVFVLEEKDAQVELSEDEREKRSAFYTFAVCTFTIEQIRIK